MENAYKGLVGGAARALLLDRHRWEMCDLAEDLAGELAKHDLDWETLHSKARRLAELIHESAL